MALPQPYTFLLLLLALLPARSDAAPQSAEAMRILKANCFNCHNEEKKKGGLVMTTREGLLKGGETGAALVPGDPAKGEMIPSLEAGADPHMPPKKQLTPAQIDVLTRWVKEGAPWDAAALAAESAPRPVTLAALPPSYHPVLAMALSPDASRLAVGCGNQLLVFTVAATNLTLAGRAEAHPDPVQSIAWSADGARIASGAFRRVVIWTAATLAKERELTAGLTDRITALRFLGKENRLVIADGRMAESGIIRLADLASGAITASWPAHSDTIFDLALSADGKLLATAGGDKLVKIWDLPTQKETARLEGHVAQVLSVAFNADGSQLVSGGADQQLKVWDVKTKERITSLGTHTSAINAVTWSPSGPILAVTNAGTAMNYTELKAHSGGQRSDAAKERKLEAVEGTLYCVAATPTADRVFAGSEDGRVLVWNKDGKLATKLEASEVKATAAK